MIKAEQLSDDVVVLPSYHPLPGIGVLTINGFLLRSEEPMLIDSSTTNDCEDYLAALRETIDLQSLRWLWLTHTDADHIGALQPLLKEVPHLKVITNYTGLAKLSTFSPVPPRRVQLLNPGQSLAIGDRTVTAFRPPLYDAPETMGFFDDRSGTLFSSDCFGSIVPEVCQAASDLPDQVLHDGQLLWTSIDTPWVNKIDRSILASELDAIRDLEPSMLLSAHLSGAGTMVDRLLEGVSQAPDGPPFVGHDQETLERMLSEGATQQSAAS